MNTNTEKPETQESPNDTIDEMLEMAGKNVRHPASDPTAIALALISVCKNLNNQIREINRRYVTLGRVVGQTDERLTKLGREVLESKIKLVP